MLIRSSYGFVIAFVMLSVVGLALLPRLPVQLVPSAGGRSLRVVYAWAGASPEAVERQVTSRLEGAFALLAGVHKISSVSGYNRGAITLELDSDVDGDAIRFELAQLVRQVYAKLPAQLTYPEITVNPSDEAQRTQRGFAPPLLTMQLSGSASSGELQRYAEEQLKPRLAAVADVGSVVVYGGTRPEWVLTYNADALTALQLTKADLRRAVQQQFSRQPLGQLRQGNGQTLRVSLNNDPSTQSNVSVRWDFPVANRAGRLIRLSDLVTVSRQEPPTDQFYRINGQTAINLVVSAVAGANQLTTAANLRRQLAALTLPPGYHLDISYDTTVYIRENLRKVGVQTGVAVVVLLLFVALTTRSRRYVTLIVTSTLVTLLLSVGVFMLLHVELHLYSLAALTTSLGIVMDNVIVMTDHYRRYRDGRVFTALLGATLTTCAGLVVVWFLPEENRQALSDFAVVMAVTLFVSLLVSVGFVPAVMARFWPEPSGTLAAGNNRRPARRWLWWERTYGRLITYLIRFRGLVLVSAVLLFGLPVFWLPNKLPDTNPLATWYNPVFGSDLYTDTIQPLANKWLGGTLRLFVNYVYEGSYQREPERTALYIVAELPNQSTPGQMNAVFRQFEAELSQYGEIDQYITQVNSGQEGSLVVYFKQPHDAGLFPYQLKNRAILLSTEMSGIEWDIFGVGQGFSQNLNEDETPTFSVELLGYNYQQLGQQASLLAQMLEKHPRVETVNLNRSPGLFQRKRLYEFALAVDAPTLAMHGTNTSDLYTYLADFNARSQPDLYVLTGADYEAVNLQSTQSQRVDNWMLQRQPMLLGGMMLKLTDAATVTRQRATPEIYRENQQYRRVISFEYLGSANFGEKFLTNTLNELRPNLPMGYSVKAIDRFWFGTDQQTPYKLLGLVVVLIYLICAIIFESLWQPLALIGLIPLSYTGVFLAFYVTDSNFDQGGYAGFVLLAGNVVCAGIFIVAEMNRLSVRYPRLPVRQTYLKAFRHKCVAVMLTVVSTIVGMVPFLIYDKEPFWYALGIGTIGGLTMSLLVMLFMLPTLLLWFQRRQPIATHT
ncbi:efflux RND transporter permease subunit [uncultured Fibrella sp.]|uniref:efflux RND transporter permease subunit n=1 Tax=uncultured Fibrella sp. TaxID=1284596 RepID=UPI0035C9E678